MKDFYINANADSGQLELYTLIKISRKEHPILVELAGTEFFLRYEDSYYIKDSNIPVISIPKTKWFSDINGAITIKWSAATYVAIPNGYQFQ